MVVQPCSVPEEPAKRERDLPVLISFSSWRERPGISQHVATERNKVSHLVTDFGFGLRLSVGRRHHSRFGSGGSVAPITGSCRGRFDDGSIMALFLAGPVVNIAHSSTLFWQRNGPGAGVPQEALISSA
jgi:hypothetical protein